MKDLDLICLKKAKINYKRSIWRYGEYLKPSLPPPLFLMSRFGSAIMCDHIEASTYLV